MAIAPKRTGKVTLHGRELTWTSPSLAQIEEYERTTGLLSELHTINCVAGRVGLAAMVLKKSHPELTPAEIFGWLESEEDPTLWGDLLGLALDAVPLLSRLFARGGGEQTQQQPDSSESAPADSSGPQASPEESASPTSS